MHIRFRLVAVLAASLALLSIGAPAAAQNASGDPTGSRLSEALSFAPSGTIFVGFTDFTALKAAHGLEDLDSTTPADQRLDGMIELTRDEAIFSGYGLSYLQGHADAWGWDASDLDWDARFDTEDGPVWVLRFRDDLDLAPFVARLDERDFDTRRVGDTVVRSHDFDFTADWSRTTEMAIINTALLADGRTALMAGSPEVLDAALAAHSVATPDSLGATPAAMVAAVLADSASAALDHPLSAALELAPGACLGFGWAGPGAAATDAEVGSRESGLVEAVGPLSAWTAMGVATYRDRGEASLGRLAWSFEDAETASSELDARLRLAREGISDWTAEPYAESVFEVVDGQAEGSVMTIDVRPIADRSFVLQQALYARDLLPARCDPGA